MTEAAVLTDQVLARWVLRIHRAAMAADEDMESLRLEVKAAREAGLSWAMVAQGLGVSRQGAHKTWAHRILEEDE